MKKQFKTGILALALAAGTIGAFAMSPAPTNMSTKSQTLQWFDSTTGAYLGANTSTGQETSCGSPKQRDCAFGYASITGGSGNEQPVGTVQYTARKKNP